MLDKLGTLLDEFREPFVMLCLVGILVMVLVFSGRMFYMHFTNPDYHSHYHQISDQHPHPHGESESESE